MKKRISLIVLMMCAIECLPFEFKCPDRSEWRFRAKGKCDGRIDMYFCVFDENEKIYMELCLEDTRFNKGPQGKKNVFRGNLDGEMCSADKYQPILFSAIGNIDCIFGKSLCNYEGLVVYNNGNTTTDRTCSCDDTKDYHFITQPKNKCYCRSDVEDCSCFMKKCQKDYVLSKDFTCESRYQVSVSSKPPNLCNSSGTYRPALTERENILINLNDSDFNESHFKGGNGKTEKTIIKVGVVCIIVYIIVCSFACFLVLHREIDKRADKAKPNSHSDISVILPAVHPSNELNMAIQSVSRQNSTENIHEVIDMDDLEGRITTVSPSDYEIKEKTLSHAERPRVIVPQHKYVVSLGENVTLACKLESAINVDSIKWIKNSSDMGTLNISSNNRYEGGTVQIPSLTIKKVRNDDYDDYICYALNSLGTGESDKISLKCTQEITTNRMYITQDFNESRHPSASVDRSLNISSARKYAQVAIDNGRMNSRKLIEEEIRVVLIGKAGVGKSSTCNTIAGKKICEYGLGGKRITTTTTCAKVDFKGKNILLIDTPGIFDSEERDKATKDGIREEVGRCVELASPGIHVILFVMEVGRCTEDSIKTIEEFLEFFGREKLVKHVIVVFTHSGALTKEGMTIEKYKSTLPEVVMDFINDCGNRCVMMENDRECPHKQIYADNLVAQILCHKKDKDLGYTDIWFEEKEEMLKAEEHEYEKKVVQDFEIEVAKIRADVEEARHNSGDYEDIDKEIDELEKKYSRRLTDLKKDLENVRDKIREKRLK